MPANLNAASPVGVFPPTFYTSFSESRIFPMMAAVYHDGVTERSLIVDGVNNPQSIRSWKLSVRKKSSDLVTIRNFFESHQGGVIPFYWYNPFEGTPVGSNYDATGANTTGRHIVKFTNQSWNEISDVARCNTQFELQEIA